MYEHLNENIQKLFSKEIHNNDSKNNNYNGKREKKVKKIPPAERQLGDAVADKDNS